MLVNCTDIKTSEDEINRLIEDIDVLISRKDPLISLIKYPLSLMKNLRELSNMVEMEDIKISIVEQIKFIISNQVSNKSSNDKKFDGHMLHSVISGPPGTGKTSVAMILAKIWSSIGLLQKTDDEPEPPTNKTSLIANLVISAFSDVSNKSFETSRFTEQTLRRKIDHLLSSLYMCQSQANIIKNAVIKLRPAKTKSKFWDSLRSNSRKMTKTINEMIGEAADPYDNLQQIINNIEPEPEPEPTFVVATRKDLIAEYLGQTAPKTKAVLDSARGGVLFIDEAYSLCSSKGDKDQFGEACLTTINEYMSLYPNEIIVIFAGYKDKLNETIFRAQPGLKSRCAWFFEIKGYSSKGLSKIFQNQLNKNGWIFDKNIDIETIFNENMDIITDFGRSTEKLSLYVKLAYGSEKFKHVVEKSSTDVKYDNVITRSMIDVALTKLKNNNGVEVMDVDPPTHLHLYT
jgi:SpoVK/Ycf46/Vps4 family AAA+-type ATPase